MRIIIDMQGAQAESNFRDPRSYSLSLALAMARTAGAHEIWLVLNAAFPESILDIRRAFADLISEECIRVFEVPTPIAAHDPANAWRASVAGKIREHFISSLKPDILLITDGLSGGWSDDVVATVSGPVDEIKTCVFLHENIPSFLDAAKNDDPDLYEWCLSRIQSLSCASLIIAKSEAIRHDLIKRLGLLEDQIITVEDDWEFGGSSDTALRVLEVCESIYQQTEKEKCEQIHGINLQKYRPRLAFISPLPPEKTGVADYSAELLPELARYYDIELVTDQQEVSDLWPDAKFTIRTVAWFKLNHDRYERVLYHLGNSIFHRHMFGLLNEVPGVVVLHDFFLSHVLADMDATGYQPLAWTDALFQSHGYAALQQRFQASETDQVMWHYPCNLGVLQVALGVIVHTESSQRLAAQWYGGRAGMAWAVIPHLRVPAQQVASNAARRTLNLSENNFIVCSFGMLGPAKLNQRLLDAWLNSSLSKNERCLLVFVGENDEGNYGIELLKTIKESGFEKRIYITGWADTATFRQYLGVADAGVQLRTLSRGETSGTVLDCMNYGLPTIVNANGSMADLPKDAVWMLPDEFTDAELVDALETLWQDGERRNKLATRAREVICTQHDPGACSNQYAQAIESMYQRAANGLHDLVKTIAALDNLPSDNIALELVARSVAASFPPEPSQRQLLIDVSSIVQLDLKSGIERVVRAQLMELIKNPPSDFRVEPVYLTDQGGHWHYRYARSYTCKMLGIQQANLCDTWVDISQGDVFYAPDFFPDGVISSARSGIYLKWKAGGLSINFLIHDLLPVLKPEFFPAGADIIHATWLKTIAEFSSRLICISNAVADELRLWLKDNAPESKDQLIIDVVHHGADILATAPSKGLPDNAEKVLKAISATPTFVMVGTIEPRKGHLQTLAAFELLWEQGHQINLVIVGKEGWMALPNDHRRTIPEIVAKLRNHKESGNRLFWLDGISDEYLEKIYAACTCLISASEGEGFGLPLIEAAQHKLPIIARDIPVFREVAGEHAYYFSGLNQQSLTEAVKNWLTLDARGDAPQSAGIPWQTWEQNAQQLLKVIIPEVILPKVVTANADKRQLLIDASSIMRHDLKSGIERVVRAELMELIKNPPRGFKVEPVYLTDQGGWHYRYARSYTSEILGIEQANLCDAPLDIGQGDIFYGLDYFPQGIIEAAKSGIYSKWKAGGLSINFMVYDLLPVLRPEFFPDGAGKIQETWLKTIAEFSSRLICISNAVADELRLWLENNTPVRKDQLMIDAVHLGADIMASVPSTGLSDNAEQVLETINTMPTFILVGTIEPRKGYLQVLAAFELLWEQGYQVNLVIVGKEGWKSLPNIRRQRRTIPQIVAKLRKHKESGNRLFWLDGISDEYLEKIYATGTCLIVASEGEGFGLPLIEAAQHKLPIIARDIPVFREVAGEHAYYFNGLDPQSLAESVKSWLTLDAGGEAPQSADMPWLTWEQSTRQLLKVILPKTVTANTDKRELPCKQFATSESNT